MISKRIKSIKKAFKTILKDYIYEILNDDDDQVAVEAISILINFFYLFQERSF